MMIQKTENHSKVNTLVLIVLIALTLISLGTATHWTFTYKNLEWEFFLMLELCAISSMKGGLILHYYMELKQAPIKYQFAAYSLIVSLCIVILKMPTILGLIGA